MNSVNLDKYSDPFFLGETKEELRRIRQDFHVHPEIGLVTPRTSRIIADLLKDYGVDEVHEGVGGDGVVGVIYGKLPGEASVGLRADIDALPLKELSNHDHVSQVAQCMPAVTTVMRQHFWAPPRNLLLREISEVKWFWFSNRVKRAGPALST